jgi:hypothetical protein
MKIYYDAGIRAVKSLTLLLFFALTGCDIWNSPLAQPIIDKLNATYAIEIKRYPAYFLQDEPDPNLAANEWKNEQYLEVIGTKGDLEEWSIPIDTLTIADFDSKKPAGEPQSIKVSYHDTYNGELSAEFQIVIFESGAKLYRVYPDKDNWLVPSPSIAEAGSTIEVFTYQPDSYFVNPYSLKYLPNEAAGEGINIKRSENGSFVFKMPAYDVKLDAGFYPIGSAEAFNINKNSSYPTLDQAVSDSANGEIIIILKDGIVISSGITIDGKSITLQPKDGAPKTIKRDTANTQSLFTVKNGGNLTLDNAYSTGLTIDGNGTNAYSPLVEVDGGTLTMDGQLVTLKNNHNHTGNGGGVYVKNGLFAMNGGTISGNKTFNNQGHGGGVYAGSGAVVNVYGGFIDGNEAAYGGGIQIGEYSSGIVVKAFANINGDVTIRNNAGTKGAGLNIDIGELTMLDGIITGNAASDYGGGVHINNGGTFSLKGGLIKDNTNGGPANGRDVYVETGNGTFIQSGGTAEDVHY